MKILVIGSGGREHALIWKIKQSPLVKEIFCAPGNAGTARLGINIPIDAKDLTELLAFAKKSRIDLTVIGPEVPLDMGIVDLFEAEGLKILGPSQKAAQLEANKAFSKDMMKKYGVPTARYSVFDKIIHAQDFVEDLLKTPPFVIKASGLAAGKGVVIAQSIAEANAAIKGMLTGKLFGDAGREIVIEEYLSGEEASFLAFTDGRNIIPLASSQDHKKLLDGDLGPNTGGMGAYSPAPVVTPAIHDKVMVEVMRRMVDGMAKERRTYRGILYAGLMINGDDIKTLEFNCRFGDPECQPLMMRLKSDIVPIMMEIANHGDIRHFKLDWDPRPALCIVQAAHGYPDAPRKGDEIVGLHDLDDWKDIVAFLAGVKVVDGKLVTDGGRITGITGIAETMQAVIDLVYPAAHMVDFDGRQFRDDIGRKALGR
ncbi:MAG: Phosphoribosylamine-glycine ligase [Parcubacteria group bacterium GW2011_GWE2_39_37]|uniref:Phosphoribosylamine--glycine ligase n=1 Tax=Candidatus Falkowbacteria bacterium GW2011_GWF2_39_8 TaxID=1618642 RepID=A0A0G0SDM4_9BACT|nr:MAG: Phosphoribosylamine-glycine ligase [Parcubacteria group bacterium GW2011_GWE2_39_37]KKR32805.1 MAG: Phosphoribosylamine-glycine ligase [Candidatus Falkowbacteria bacterium GW2011_GWF2_39_8]